MQNRKIAEIGAHPPQIANFTRVITACTDFISKMLRSGNEHHATCRRARDVYGPHKGHHVDEHHSSQNSTGFTADQDHLVSGARIALPHRPAKGNQLSSSLLAAVNNLAGAGRGTCQPPSRINKRPGILG